jgi:membrane protein
VPTQILNECLNRLTDLQLVSMVPPEAQGGGADYLYQPARPLDRITLGDFKHRFENHGEEPFGGNLQQLDPVLARYKETLHEQEREPFFTNTLAQLFAELPFDESKPPFAFADGMPTKRS